jgi:hypothetical protein
MSTFGDKITWDEANFLWNDNPYTWDDVRFIITVTDKGGGNPDLIKKELDKDEEKKKRFIEILVKVKGNQEYSSPYIYNQKKEVQDDLEVSVEDIKLVVQEVLGINLEIKNIHV